MGISDEGVVVTEFVRPMTAKEFAEWRGISVKALAQERYRGQGPKFVKMGARVYYLPEHIKEYMEANVRETTVTA